MDKHYMMRYLPQLDEISLAAALVDWQEAYAGLGSGTWFP